MTGALEARIGAGLAAPVAPQVRDFARSLGEADGVLAVLFYGSNLRTGALDGVLDFYALRAGPPEKGPWPRVSYHERATASGTLRAKVATMTLARFAEASAGDLLDTTIWARFVQPSALAWTRDRAVEPAVVAALAAAARTAGRLAAALGPQTGAERDFWAALFRATYRAEFRVERAGREAAILTANAAHFEGLLPLAWEAAGIGFETPRGLLHPLLTDRERARIDRWWRWRVLAGKPLNLMRLLRAPATFDGAARYAAWKIERHTGLTVRLSPWRERHPLLAAPGVLWSLWRHRRRAARAGPRQGA